jgi:glycosyltransferase involved in cell wall biosynthesis
LLPLSVIGAAHGAIPEYVHHDVNGLLFTPGSASSLRRQIMRVVHDPGLIARLSAGISPPARVEAGISVLARCNPSFG